MSDDHVLRFYQERLAVLASRVRAAGVRGEDAIDDLPARLAADPLHEAAADERCADQVVPVGHGDRDAVVRDEIATLARVGRGEVRQILALDIDHHRNRVWPAVRQERGDVGNVRPGEQGVARR